MYLWVVDYWAAGLGFAYLVLALVMWRSKTWAVYLWFTVMVWWSVSACVLWILPPSDLDWWILALSLPLRIAAANEAFRAITMQLKAQPARLLAIGGISLAVAGATLFLFDGSQPGLTGIQLVIFKARDCINLACGCALMFGLGSIWVKHATLKTWLGQLSIRHAVLLGLLCLIIPAVDFMPARTAATWDVLSQVRYVVQYGLLACWCLLLSRFRSAAQSSAAVS